MVARLLLTAAIAAASLGCGAQRLPVFPARNVPETHFGTVVDDPYRALEDVKDPEVAAWMRAHAEHARRTIERLAGYAAIRARVAELDDAAEARVDQVQRLASGDVFFTRRGAKDNTYKLYLRRADGEAGLLVDPDDWQKKTGRPHAINYFAPSPDGKLVAFGVSAVGSEDASLHLMDVATRRRVGKPIERVPWHTISWRDGGSFFFMRMQKLEPGMPVTERYRNSRSWLHVVGADAEDTLALGRDVSATRAVSAMDFPVVLAPRGSRFAIAAVYAGVQREVSIHAAPLDSVGKPDTPWVEVCDRADKVTDFAVKGDDIYLLTHRDSPRLSVVKTSLAAASFDEAETVLPASDRVLIAIAAARDGLYVVARDGAVKRLERVRWGGREPTVVKLPLEGAVNILTATPEADGAIVSLAAWTRAREIYAVDASGKVTNTELQPLGPFDAPADLVATEVQVKSHDGAMVPLSIIHKKGVTLDGGNPTLLYGYGAYGETEEPDFEPARLSWLERGGVYAVANVRGSGVYGQEWYQAGYKATKPNTWKDFIACAEYLIAEKYTTSRKLGIHGGSAGGILVGRAMTERPDLFGAVIPAVGALDMVRFATAANGPVNVPEFGDVGKEPEFRALLAMSSYHHVKDGERYPAVLLTHGVNDPRVDVWHSSKMAARLMAASRSGAPILLDLDYESGHGVGDTKAQRQKQLATNYAFFFWHAGHADFQPR
jgi:prolyl oligopeptidase